MNNLLNDNINFYKKTFIIFYQKNIEIIGNNEEIIHFSAIKIKNNLVDDFMHVFIQPEFKYNASHFLTSGIQEKFLLEFGMKKNIAYKKIINFIKDDEIMINFGLYHKDFDILKNETKKYKKINFLEINKVVNLNLLLKNLLSNKTISINNLQFLFNQKNKFLDNVYSNVISLSKIWVGISYILNKLKISLNDNLSNDQIKSIKQNFKKIINSKQYFNNLLKFKISLRLKLEKEVDISKKENQKNLISKILESQELNIEDLINNNKEFVDTVEIKINEKIQKNKLSKIKKQQKKQTINEKDVYLFSKLRKSRLNKKKKI